MFEFLKGGNSGNEGMDRKTVTSEHANIKTVDTGGSVLVEEVELAQKPETNGDTVELAKFREDRNLLSENHPDTLHITEAQARESSLFTDEEVEELSRADSGLSEEEEESIRKVEKALEDPKYPDNRTDLHFQLCQEEGKWVRDMPDYDDPQERIRDELSDRPWVEDQPSEKPISEMTGAEFRELLSESTGDSNTEEELAEPTESEEESGVDVVRIDSETADLAAESFESRNKSYWQDIAEDLSQSDENTLFESVGPNSRRVTTKDPEMKRALRNHETEPFDGTVDLKQDTGDTVVAVVSKED